MSKYTHTKIQRIVSGKHSRRALFPISTNYIAPIDIKACTVTRKGKVIKGETEIAIAVAVKERNEVRNALKRQRKARRAA